MASRKRSTLLNVTAQASPTVVIAEAHAAATAILSATGRDIFEATEVANLLDLAEAAATAAEAAGLNLARDELFRRASEGRAQLSGSRYISATRAHDIALDCWGPLEALVGQFN